MWLKILCVVVMTSGAAAVGGDALLESMYGVQGRNQVTLCVAGAAGRWRRCGAALYTREWLLARAHCLATARSPALRAVRLSAGATCDDIAAGRNPWGTRAVRHHVMHPFFDLALVIVDYPYNDLDALPNATTVKQKFKPHGVYKWMKKYFDAYALSRDPGHHINRIARNMKTYHYPVWFFLMTMVMPSVLFMLFFIYVIFYTGSPQEVPYKKLRNSKKVTHI